MAYQDSDDVTFYGAPGQNDWNSSVSTKLEDIQFEQSRGRGNVWDSGSTSSSSSLPAICKLYPLGKCRFGLACRYRHVDSSDIKVQSSFDDFKKRVRERVESFSLTCNVCFENPLCRRRRFGMLTSCNHVFCLTCIREWRQQQEAEFCKACPVCRMTSHFVVPTDRHVSNPERKCELIRSYQENMGQIPCTYYDFGNGKCPFGSSCFYLHINMDGSVVDKSRLKISEDGTMTGVEEVSLGSFMKITKRKKRKKKRR